MASFKIMPISSLIHTLECNCIIFNVDNITFRPLKETVCNKCILPSLVLIVAVHSFGCIKLYLRYNLLAYSIKNVKKVENTFRPHKETVCNKCLLPSSVLIVSVHSFEGALYISTRPCHASPVALAHK